MNYVLLLYVLPLLISFFGIRYMTKEGFGLDVEDAEDGKIASIIMLIPVLNIILAFASIILTVFYLTGIDIDNWYELVFGKHKKN